MEINYGKGTTKYGPGVEIKLTGNELVTAINAYLLSHDVYIHGSRTITVNGKSCKKAEIYVDPNGSVFANGQSFSGGGS